MHIHILSQQCQWKQISNRSVMDRTLPHMQRIGFLKEIMAHCLHTNLFHLSLFGLHSWHHIYPFQWRLFSLPSHTNKAFISNVPLLLNSLRFTLMWIYLQSALLPSRQFIVETARFCSTEQDGNGWPVMTSSLYSWLCLRSVRDDVRRIICSCKQFKHWICIYSLFWLTCFTYQTPWQGTSQGSVPKPNSVLYHSNTASWCTDHSARLHSDH